MLDNIRRKFSYSTVKVFYDKRCDLGRFEDLIYYRGVGSALPYMRGAQKKSNKSFRYIYESSNNMKLKDVEIKMILCPAGTFEMGHNELYDNLPRPEIIESSFLLGETEITQELYQAVMGINPSEYKSPQKPVENVSWGEAILFCNALSKLQGLDLCYIKNSDEEYDWLCNFSKNGYRLPTEKEWEYAAKAGTNNQYAGTNMPQNLEDYAIYNKGKIGTTKRYQTEPVATKLPNEWGFYDMTGNVWEWCWEKKPDNSADRVRRGGCWITYLSDSLSANREYGPPRSLNSVGFRVCRSIVN